MDASSRARYFEVEENVISGEIYALMDDIHSANELNIDNLMNDSDTKYVVEEKIQPDQYTQDTKIITLEVNTHVVSSDPLNEKQKKKDK